MVGTEKGITGEPLILQTVFHKDIVDSCQDIVDNKILVIGHLVGAGDAFLLVVPVLFVNCNLGGEVHLLTLNVERNPNKARGTLFLVFPEVCLYRNHVGQISG